MFYISIHRGGANSTQSYASEEESQPESDSKA